MKDQSINNRSSKTNSDGTRVMQERATPEHPHELEFEYAANGEYMDGEGHLENLRSDDGKASDKGK